MALLFEGIGAHGTVPPNSFRFRLKKAIDAMACRLGEAGSDGGGEAMSGSNQPQPWAITEENSGQYRELIGTTVEGDRGKWNKLDIGGGVTIKNKGKYFSRIDIKSTMDVFTEARSAINAANQIVNGALETWPDKARELAARYFFIASEALQDQHAQIIRRVVSAAQTGLHQPISLKIMDLNGTRASVPQNSQAFVEEKGLQVKRSWITHQGLDSSTTIHALGIRFDRGYLQGAQVKDQEAPSIQLRAKTLIHEATHRFANTKDHAYFKDNGRDLDVAPVPPPQGETEKWLDNADSFGWFCIKLASA